MALRHGIAIAFSSYEELIDSPHIDAVYICLPNGHHKAWTIRSLGAGKHVLCEKPLGLSAAEIGEMIDAATGADKVLLEAMHYRYSPVTARVCELACEMTKIEHIRATFNTLPPRIGDIRYQAGLGGGSLLDLGVYCFDVIRLIAERTGIMGSLENPEVTRVVERRLPSGVDRFVRADLKWSAGATARGSCSFMSLPPRTQMLDITGGDDHLRVKRPFLPHRGHMISGRINGRRLAETLKIRTTYEDQLSAFAARIRRGETGQTDDLMRTRKTMSILDEVRRSSPS